MTRLNRESESVIHESQRAKVGAGCGFPDMEVVAQLPLFSLNSWFVSNNYHGVSC